MLTAMLLSSVIVSLNPCFDDWLPQWLGQEQKIVPTTVHGQRLEAILQADPDVVISGGFVNRSLRLALQKRVELKTLPYVTSYSEWESAALTLAKELQHEPSMQRWLALQQRQLQEHNIAALGEVLVLMPNAYTWGQQSWVANLLQQHGGQLSPLMGAGELLRLSLEEVLLSEPDTVILEGFADDYARAHDWLWHRAVQRWLAQRQVVQVSGEIAGCSDVRAADYLNSINPQHGAQLWGE